MPVQFERRVVLVNDVLMRELEQESVILNLNSECYFGLDEIGTRMLNVLIGSESIEHAYEALLAEYEVEPQQLRGDLGTLVEKLLERGIVQIENPQAG